MANRRMFSLNIVDSDAFLDLPISAQALYFHLGMRADDRGYVANAKSITRTIGATIEDLEKLIQKKFLLKRNEQRLVLIKGRKMNNYIQNDRFTESKYINDMHDLYLDENNCYTVKGTDKPVIKKEIGVDKNSNVSTLDTGCIHSVYTGQGRIELGKMIKTDKNRYKGNSYEALACYLFNSGYCELNDYNFQEYSNFIKELLQEYEFKDVKIKIHYFIKNLSFLKATGKFDKSGKEIIKRIYDKTNDEIIANKFMYFKESITNNLKKHRTN